MSVTFTFSGQSFTIPSQAERNWATQMNAYLLALAGNSLPRAGGSFVLAADLDLGATANVYLKGLVSKTTGPASAGYIRMANNEGLGWRNFAGTSDISLKVNASDQLEFNGVPLPSAAGTVTLTGAQTVQDKTFTNVAGVTLQAGASLDWAAGNAAIAASMNTFGNILNLGAALTTINIPGIFTTKTFGLNNNTLNINNSAAGSGADWKLTLTRPLAGMTAAATVTLPISSTTLIGNNTFDTLTGKSIDAANNTLSNIPTAIANGGAGQANANAALNALLPTQATNATKFLQTDGTNTSWSVSSGGLTAVPVTTSGTSVNNSKEEIDTTAGAVTRTLPVSTLAQSITYIDRSGACSATNFIRITPGGTDKIQFPSGATTDSLVLRRKNVTVSLDKAAGDTTWYVTYQMVALPNTTLDAGIYTPIAVSNAAGVVTTANLTGLAGKYSRVGNIVTVTATCLANAVTAGNASFRLTLPVASNLLAVNDIIGNVTCFSSGASSGGRAYADTANKQVIIDVPIANVTVNDIHITFQYEVK